MTPAESLPRFTIRNRPEDFVVVEEPLYPASGSGGHLFVEVEKRGRTTEQVARELARRLSVEPMDVGYAGRKDRHALTRQWFSLPGIDAERALAVELEGARVLAAVPHEHKLKTGHLRGNHFDLAVRCEHPFDPAGLAPRVEALRRRGMPNRYGEQRFGRAGDNAAAGRELLAGRLRSRDRRAARFLLSALQSEVFNAVLDARSDDYDDVRVGDLARVEASGGLFWVEDLERERPRAGAFEISATGPIFGTKVRQPRGEVAALEAEILERHGIPSGDRLTLPRGLRAEGTRRPLRVAPRSLEVLPLEDGHGFRLRSGLPAGAYVTVLLDCLVEGVREADRTPDRTLGRAPESGDGADSGDVCSNDAT